MADLGPLPEAIGLGGKPGWLAHLTWLGWPVSPPGLEKPDNLDERDGSLEDLS